MATKDEASNGLLSKMVRFVRNPTTNWADLDQKETDRESTYTKQALKEMIERKRRNDFVRKREFDMLRKMRKREAMSGQEPGARPSFFQSSLPSKPDDRAMTLKKIDEIEAQMSMQWWKTKHGANSSLPPSSSNFPNSDIPSSDAFPGSSRPTSKALAPNQRPATGVTYDKTAPAGLSTQREMPTQPPLLSIATPAVPASTVRPPNPSPPQNPAPSSAKPRPNASPVLHAMGGLAASYDGATTGFSASKLYALEVGEVQHDPEVEEAAIRFANGDESGAEAALREALGPRGSRSSHEDTWYALFDLYRASGMHDAFEGAAIDFAGRFNRSAPVWFSMPELVGRMVEPKGANVLGGTRAADWRCPTHLTVQTLAALNAALSKAPMPWHLDWSKLQVIDNAAVVPLTRLFGAWAAQPVQLRFMGSDQLQAVLQAMAPSGKPEQPADGWRLRMETLRIMHRPDEFELTALDYCVTYEVSPPAWENARCEFKSLDESAASKTGQTIIGEAFSDSMISGVGGADSETASGQLSQVTAVELAGHILGDASAALDKLETRMAGADILVISCAKLIRVDFSAAGSLLNWVTARQAEGRSVQFSDVHRLVGAFFHVIGISEHAKVTPRRD